MIYIPLETPSGRKIERVGIWMSGGSDSSLLAYVLAKYIIDNNLQIKLVPLTIDYKRPFQYIAVEVRKKIVELLGKDIFEGHVVYHPLGEHNFTAEELRDEFHHRNYENFKQDKIQVLYSGITTNPPVDVQKTFNWGVLEDVEAKRGLDIKKQTHRYFTKIEDGKEYEFYEIKPYFEADKRYIASLYDAHNLMDTLFPLTRSCEDLETVRGHCGKCWWCEERMWGFGTL